MSGNTAAIDGVNFMLANPYFQTIFTVSVCVIIISILLFIAGKIWGDFD